MHVRKVQRPSASQSGHCSSPAVVKFNYAQRSTETASCDTSWNMVIFLIHICQKGLSNFTWFIWKTANFYKKVSCLRGEKNWNFFFEMWQKFCIRSCTNLFLNSFYWKIYLFLKKKKKKTSSWQKYKSWACVRLWFYSCQVQKKYDNAERFSIVKIQILCILFIDLRNNHR